jgi:PAS domain S-box-containing protein
MDHRRHFPTSEAASPAAHGFLEVCTEASVFVRLDGTIGAWGAEARRMFGRSPKQVVGLPFCSLFTADSHDAIDDLAWAAQWEPRHVLATAVDADGTPFDAEVTSTRTLSVRDGGTGSVELVRDVSEGRAVEACLVACSGHRDRRSVLAGLAEALGRWMHGADLALRVHGHNGRRVERVAGVVEVPLSANGEVFATLAVRFGDAAMATPRIVRLLGSVGKAIGATILRALEFEEKSRAIGRLERRGPRDSELLALVTHDMRTPLAVIAGFASSLRDNWDELPDCERVEGLDAILRNGKSLTRLVEQDLQLALAETGERRCDLEPFDLGVQVERIVDDFVTTSDAHVAVRVTKPLALVRGDEQRNSQILTNLLSNAVKFSPPGALVEVDVFERSPMAHVTVRDQGRGIAGRDKRKLFHKFGRVGDAGAVSGTGLGLYVAKGLVESQGGRIWVDSSVGGGSAFTYTLPLADERLPIAEAAAGVG